MAGDREKASDIIINNEMLLMSHLHYQLTVHNPYRAVEGALIDIKVFTYSLLCDVDTTEDEYEVRWCDEYVINYCEV